MEIMRIVSFWSGCSFLTCCLVSAYKFKILSAYLKKVFPSDVRETFLPCLCSRTTPSFRSIVFICCETAGWVMKFLSAVILKEPLLTTSTKVFRKKRSTILNLPHPVYHFDL